MKIRNKNCVWCNKPILKEEEVNLFFAENWQF